MHYPLVLAVLASLCSNLNAAVVEFENAPLEAAGNGGLPWVGPSTMYDELVTAGGNGLSQVGFSVFDDDTPVSGLNWGFGGLSLYTGDGSLTVSPGPATAGCEDYRITNPGADNLEIWYEDGGDAILWATGQLVRFVTEVDNNADFIATGWGIAYLTSHTAEGQAFYDEVGALSGGDYKITFIADSFQAVSPGHFESDGRWSVVPEPSTYAAIAGMLALGLCVARRRR